MSFIDSGINLYWKDFNEADVIIGKSYIHVPVFEDSSYGQTELK